MEDDLKKMKEEPINQKQVRSVSELAVPAWQGAITQEDKNEIERVQKVLGGQYVSYKSALKYTGMETLESRRVKLCLKFARKAEKHPKHKAWFKPCNKTANTRQEKPRYCPVVANKRR